MTKTTVSDSVEENYQCLDNQLRNILYTFLFLAVSGCGLSCKPSECTHNKVIIEQLNPIALFIENSIAAGNGPPRDLEAALMQSLPTTLPRGAILSQPYPKPNASYHLALPDTQEEIRVTYSVHENYPSFSFEYVSRSGIDSCYWEVEETKWKCIRR